MLPKSWQPTETTELVRVGAPHDGGYLVPPECLRHGQTLLSMGLGSDWSFEADFLRRTQGNVVCYDHTVTTRFWLLFTFKRIVQGQWGAAPAYLRYRRFFSQSNVTHRQIRVGYDLPDETSLTTALTSTESDVGDALLKVDIEGAEYRILGEIVENRQTFAAVIIEFHDIDLHRERIDSFVRGMEGFGIVWIHGNNFGGVDNAGDPRVVEMTLARRDVAHSGSTRATQSTSSPNDPDHSDIELMFER